MKPFFRKLHRWLGLAMALQIIAWMASGLYFAIIPIETIRSEHLAVAAPHPPAESLAGLIPVQQAWQAFAAATDAEARLLDVSLQNWQGRAVYRVTGLANGQRTSRLVDSSGSVVPMISADQATALARAGVAGQGTVDAVDWVEEAEPDSEIRGRPLPIWKVRFSEPKSLAVYLDPWTGEVLARRTTQWRIFDFLWMLHIMDFEARDNFNTPLLQVAAAFGLLVAISGVVFWAMTSRLFRRRRIKPA